MGSLGTINLLTGLNDAGKTTLLEAIFLHACGSRAGVMAVQTIRTSRRQDEYAFGNEGTNPWEGLFHNFEMDREIQFTARTAKGQSEVRLARDPLGELTTATGVGATGSGESSITVKVREGAAALKVYRQTMRISTAETGQTRTVGVQYASEPTVQEPLIHAALYKPGTMMTNLANGFSDMRKRRVDDLLTDALREVDPRIERLELLMESGQPKLHAQVTGGALVPFELLGDGPNSMAQYLVTMSTARDGVLLIDEVGSGVHHTVLPAMWRTLHRAARKLHVQIFATTHSQETLAAAHQSIHENNALYVHRLRRREGNAGETTVSTYFGAKLATALDANVDLR